MKDYIEREKVYEVIYGMHVGGKEAVEKALPNTYGADLREIISEIEDIDSADVVSRSDYENCKNELCYKCGEYKNRHLGACDGCRWRDGG